MNASMGTGKVVHVASCPIECEDLRMVTPAHELSRGFPEPTDLAPARCPCRHQGRGGTAPCLNGDVTSNVDVHPLGCGARVVQNVGQGHFPRGLPSALAHLIQIQFDDLPHRFTGQSDDGIGSRGPVQLAAPVDGHGDDGQSEIVLVFTEQAKPAGRRGGQRGHA